MTGSNVRAGALGLGAALLCVTAGVTSCSSGSERGTGGTTSTSSTSSGQGGQAGTGGGGGPATSSSSSTTSSNGGPCGLLLTPCCGDTCWDGNVCFDNQCSTHCGTAADCLPAPEWGCMSGACHCTPSGPEICDGKDNDCNGAIDDWASCGPGETCDSGACACGPGNLCSGVCTDVASDPQNCGACGTTCTKGTCALGRCLQTLATGQDGPSGIAVDAANVYWTNGHAVMKAPLGGGQAIKLWSSSGSSSSSSSSGVLNGPAMAIAVDADSVYWANPNDGTVMKIPIGGGAPTTLASGQTSEGVAIAVGGLSVYWSSGSGISDGMLRKVPSNGGAPATLASGLSWPYEIAVDAASVYGANSGGIIKVSTGGGAPTTLAAGGDSAVGIAVDATSVYWANGNDVMKVPTGGGAPVTLASGQGAYAIAVDATSVYFGSGGWLNLMKVPLGGGAPIALTSGQHVRRIAVDATSVYWTSPDGGGSVMRLTPK